MAPLPKALELLKESWEIFIAGFKTYAGIMLIPNVLTLLPIALILGSGATFDPGYFQGAGAIQEIILFLLVITIVLFFQIWGYLALIHAVQESTTGLGILEAYRLAGPKLPSFFWLSSLMGIIVFAGFLLLVVPGILFLVWFALAPYVLVGESLKGFDALSRSKQYVKGRGLEVFWRLFVITVISTVIPAAAEKGFEWLSIPFGGLLSQFLTALVFWPLITIYSFLIYQHLKTSRNPDVA